MKFLNNEKERNRFIKFAIVGAIGAVVDFGIFNLLTQLTSMAPVVASVVSFCSAVVSNFLLNRYWTYPDSRTKRLRKQLVQFGIVSLIGLGIRTPLFAWLEKILISAADKFIPQFPLSPVIVGHNVSLAIAILVVMLWNFVANRFWTYNDVD